MVASLVGSAIQIRRGQIIRTNYNTGPYLITDISGPCTCHESLYSLNDDSPSEDPHYHLTCKRHDQPDRGGYWLNGYRLDGTSVWSADRLEVIDEGQSLNPRQLELFT